MAEQISHICPSIVNETVETLSTVESVFELFADIFETQNPDNQLVLSPMGRHGMACIMRHYSNVIGDLSANLSQGGKA